MILDCVDLNSYLTYVYLHLQNSLHNKAEERLEKRVFHTIESRKLYNIRTNAPFLDMVSVYYI